MEQETESTSLTFSINEYGAILRRRRAIFLQVFFCVAIIGILVTVIQKPTYEATAKLEVEGPSQQISLENSSDPLQNLFGIDDQQTVDTQVEMLTTAPLLDQVRKETTIESPSNIKVSVVKDTNIIEVDADSHNARVAANAANALLNDYIQNSSDESLAGVRRAMDFVQRQAAVSRLELDEASDALRDFKIQHSFTDLSSARDAALTRLETLRSAYSSTQSSLAGAQSQLDVSAALLRQTPSTSIVTVPTTNPQIDIVKQQLLQLELQKLSLMGPGGYTATAPQIVAVDAQINALKSQVSAMPRFTNVVTGAPNTTQSTLQQSVASLQGQVASYQSQLSVLQQQITAGNKEVGDFAPWEVTVARLQREHDEYQSEFDTATQEMENLALREQAGHVSAHIIQPAVVPGAPVRPNKPLNIIMALATGFVLGIGAAMLMEFLDDRINSTEEAERLLGLPSLGRVPQLTSEDARLLPQMKAMDPETESYRILRQNIYFASVDNPVRVLQVTSPGPGEGKTTTAANLAFAMALDGKKVILVDTDLRRPSLHKLLGKRQIPGLTDLLLGTATISEVIHEDESLPNMSLLPAGTIAPNPSELLNSIKFRNIIQQLTGIADIVIVDSPPVSAAADAQIISHQVDGVVFVIANGETRKTSAKNALKLLLHARANVLGTAYNKTNAQDSYYYYNYHYSTPTIESDDNQNGSGPALLAQEKNNALPTK